MLPIRQERDDVAALVVRSPDPHDVVVLLALAIEPPLDEFL